MAGHILTLRPLYLRDRNPVPIIQVSGTETGSGSGL